MSRTIYWTSGLAPESERWDPFDPMRGLLRAAPSNLPGIDPAYLREATEAFARTGYRGPLNYYRAIDPFFRAVSGAFAGAVIDRPSYFLTGALDGLNAVRPATEASLRADLPDLRGVTTVPGVGHWPQLEAPAAVNAALIAFLADAVPVAGSAPREGRRRSTRAPESPAKAGILDHMGDDARIADSLKPPLEDAA